MNIYRVILDPDWVAKYRYLLDELVQIHTVESGETIAHLTCTKVTLVGPYFDAIVSSIPNGEPRRVLLNHSFVVAVLELSTQQIPFGFSHQEKSLD